MAREAIRLAEPRAAEPNEPAGPPGKTVLVVAHDSARAGEIVGALQRRGHPSLQAETPAQALYWARREPPALAILDARVEGWRPLLREFRRDRLAVMAMTDDPRERSWVLDAGCLDLSFSGAQAEDIARQVETLLRPRPEPAPATIRAGVLVVELAAHRLLWHGKEVRVPPLLLRLAAYLASHPDTIVAPRALLADVWGEPWADPNKVHQGVWRLRRSLGEPADSAFFVGRQGHGYGFFPHSAPRRARRLDGA